MPDPILLFSIHESPPSGEFGDSTKQLLFFIVCGAYPLSQTLPAFSDSFILRPRSSQSIYFTRTCHNEELQRQTV